LVIIQDCCVASNCSCWKYRWIKRSFRCRVFSIDWRRSYFLRERDHIVSVGLAVYGWSNVFSLWW